MEWLGLRAQPLIIDKEGNIASTWSGYHENLLIQRINRLLVER